MPDEEMIVEISCFEVWKQISDYVDDDVESALKARLTYHFDSLQRLQSPFGRDAQCGGFDWRRPDF